MDERRRSEISACMREIRRLTTAFLESNRRHSIRVAEITRYHQEGKQNFSGDLITVINNDLLLKQIGGNTIAIAQIIQGHLAVIQAELTYLQLMTELGERARWNQR